MNEEEIKFNHREYMTQIIETYLMEMFKHYDEFSLSVLTVSHWKDIINLGESKNHRNICHAMEQVCFNHTPIDGKYESTSYNLKFTCNKNNQ